MKFTALLLSGEFKITFLLELLEIIIISRDSNRFEGEFTFSRESPLGCHMREGYTFLVILWRKKSFKPKDRKRVHDIISSISFSKFQNCIYIFFAINGHHFGLIRYLMQKRARS